MSRSLGVQGDGRGPDLGDHQGGIINIHKFSERAPLLDKDNLNKQSEGLLGNKCSIIKLFLVVHKDQPKTEKTIQNTRASWPKRFFL